MTEEDREKIQAQDIDIMKILKSIKNTMLQCNNLEKKYVKKLVKNNTVI